MPDKEDIIFHECEKCSRLCNDFALKRWIDVPQEVIDYNNTSLPLFTPLAHRCYLPAYLLRTLEPEGERWGTTVDFVIYDLSPADAERWKEKFEIFSSDQLHVVASWFALVLEHNRLFDGDTAESQRGFKQFWAGYVA